MPSVPPPLPAPKVQHARIVGRYVMYDEIASGGIATVHFGRLRGAVGFSRTVAIKHLLPHHSRDAEFLSMFLDEARLAARIQHPNVTVPLDVVVLEESEELFLVMEYVHGDTLGRLLGNSLAMDLPVPPSISAGIMSGVLHGLHAAHEAVTETGVPLNIVHRDISPQNIMVGVDGVPRVLDFGVAKAVSRLQTTQQGQLKGKLAYMAPEQMGSGDIDRRVDTFAAGIVLWEALTLRPLFKADDPAGAVSKVLSAKVVPPSSINNAVSPALDRVALKALDRDVKSRFQTAREFAMAIEEATSVATPRRVGEWVGCVGRKKLAQRAARVSEIESSSFDADSSNDPFEVFHGKRSSSSSDANANAIQSYRDSQMGPLDHPSQLSSTQRGDRLPSKSLWTSILCWAERRWPAVTGGSLVALAAVIGIVWLSHPSPAKGARELASEQAESARGKFPQGPPSPPPMSAGNSVAVTTGSLTAVPGTARPAPVASNGPAFVPNHRSSPKAESTRSAKTAGIRANRNCNPPYLLDRNGIRRVKRECL